MEKNGEIREGVTPPEQEAVDQEKKSGDNSNLEDHVTKRAADAVKGSADK
jgi:hypothetical protein